MIYVTYFMLYSRVMITLLKIKINLLDINFNFETITSFTNQF